MMWILLLIPIGIVLFFVLRKKKDKSNIAVRTKVTIKKYKNG
mgnify:CR=1 FL=1